MSCHAYKTISDFRLRQYLHVSWSSSSIALVCCATVLRPQTMTLDIVSDPEKQADSNITGTDSDCDPAPVIVDKALERRLVRKIDLIFMPGLAKFCESILFRYPTLMI